MASESSFTKIENELARAYRPRLNSAEGAQGVQQAFAAFVQEFLSRLSGSAVVLDEGDVRVDPKAADGYTLGPGIRDNPDFARFMQDTDLGDILRRQAQDAVNKLKRLGKHSERDETKLFPRKDRQI